MNKKISIILMAILTTTLLYGCSGQAQQTNNIKTSGSKVQSDTKGTENKEANSTGSSNAEADKNSTSNQNKQEDNEKGNNTENTAIEDNKNPKETKKESKVIVIDPGHGGKVTSEKEPVSPDSKTMKAKNVVGAAGIKTRTPEHVVNLNVALKLKEHLSKAGYTVIMTRSTNSETIGNVARAEIGNNNKADLVIRIHSDSNVSSKVAGASMLVPGEVGYAKEIAEVSREYGETIFNTLVDEVKMKSRGVIVRKDLTGFNWSKVPVVLIEMGFLSNPEEDKLLSSANYQEKLALGLFKGIEKALPIK